MWRLKNKEKIKRYHVKNKKLITSQHKLYVQSNKDKINEYHRIYYKNNKNKFKMYRNGLKTYYIKYRKQYREDNKSYFKNYNKKRRQSDINYKIVSNLRGRLNCAIRGNQKSGSAVKDLGCSIEEFKKYIELKFKPGMTWENWGRDTWHLDHITPLSWFNLENRNQFLISCHYTNYQPLWAEDNLHKLAN